MNEFNCKVCGGKHKDGLCTEGEQSQGEVDEVSGDVQFFNVSDLSGVDPLSDGDKTPTVKMVRPNDRRAIVDAKKRVYEAGRNNEEAERTEEIFRAVSEGDEDALASLINREFGSREFTSLDEFQVELIQFIQGSKERSEILSIEDVNKPTVYDSKMTIIFRPRIGKSAPFLEITIGNRSNLGKSKSKKQTKFIEMRIQQRSAQQPKEEFKKTGIVNMVKSWFGGKDN